MILREFLQRNEGNDNDMKLRSIDALALGPNGNLQVGMGYFILVSGKLLQRGWKDIIL